MATWIYILIIVAVIIVLIVAYIIYRGYTKIKGNKLPNIFCPKFSHPVIGHLQELLHPLKHEFRRQLSETHATIKYYQLVMMNQVSIFINCPYEAAKLLKEVPFKGKIYHAFRFDPTIPDLFTSDTETYTKRNTALTQALKKTRVPEKSKALDTLMEVLSICAETGRAVDIKYLYSLFAMDVVAESLFNYQLDSISTLLTYIKENNNNEIGTEISRGKRLLEVIQIFQDVQAKSGIYAQSGVREISADELSQAKSDWKKFLLNLSQHIRTECELYKQQNNGQLDRHETVFNQAITKMIDDSMANLPAEQQSAAEKLSEAVYVCELHQLFRHSYECIAGTLMWLTYALSRHTKVRENIEKAIYEMKCDEHAGYPEYLEAVLCEVLRRYPVAGNLVARTAEQEQQHYFLSDVMHPAPAEIPMHVHIYTYHNSQSTWQRPLEFIPERWLAQDNHQEKRTALKSTSTYPKCPFIAAREHRSLLNSNVAEFVSIRDGDKLYDGAGFDAEAISFMPFSAGERSCKGKTLALQVLRQFLITVARNYRLDAAQRSIEEDPGISYFAAILPISKESTTMTVQRIVNLGDLVNKRGGLAGSAVGGSPMNEDDGWADEE